MKAKLAVVSGAAVVLLVGIGVFAHCQIPCGIYNDPVRFSQLKEHIATMEKSMKQIKHESGHEKPNYNQLMRWVSNKETHADEFTEIVTFYFMAQRVKPAAADDKKYIEKITGLHAMVFYAMKCKQTTDEAHIKKLRELVDAFEKSYTKK